MILGRVGVVITRRITIYAPGGHDTDIDKDINFVYQTQNAKSPGLETGNQVINPKRNPFNNQSGQSLYIKFSHHHKT